MKKLTYEQRKGFSIVKKLRKEGIPEYFFKGCEQLFDKIGTWFSIDDLKRFYDIHPKLECFNFDNYFDSEFASQKYYEGNPMDDSSEQALDLFSGGGDSNISKTRIGDFKRRYKGLWI